MAKQILSDTTTAGVQVFDLVYPTRNQSITIDGNRDICYKIEGRGYATGIDQVHYIGMQLNGLGVGNYGNVVHRSYAAPVNGTALTDVFNGPDWGFVLARVGDGNMNGWWSFTATLGPLYQLGALRFPMRSNYAFTPYNASNVYGANIYGMLYHSAGTNFTSINLGIWTVAGASVGNFDMTRISIRPFGAQG